MTTSLTPVPAGQDQQYTGDPWSRQPYDTPSSYLAFTLYRDLGPDRSLRQAELAYRQEKSLPIPAKLPSAQFAAWSSDHRWVDRSNAYDENEDRLALAAIRRKRIRTAVAQHEQATQLTEALMAPVQLFRERLGDILDGNSASDLRDLGDEDLFRLMRHAAAVIPDMHRLQRESIGSVQDQAGAGGKTVRIRGGILRRALGSPDALGILEQIAFDLQAAEVDEESPVALPNLAGPDDDGPVIDMTGDIDQDIEESPQTEV